MNRGMFMNSIIKLLTEKPIEIAALLLSLVNLYLYYKTLKKERVKLRIHQDHDEAFSFHFIWYDHYDCLFFHVNIENLSKTETSITRIIVTDKSKNKYIPSKYDVGADPFNENGITLYPTDESEGIIYPFDLRTDNLMNNLRIPSYGNVSGFIVLLDFPVINTDEIVKLTIYTPTKTFKKDIHISPLPDTIKPENP